MKNRVKEIFSPEVMDLIKKKESEGYSRYKMVAMLVNNKDKPPGELLESCRGETTDTADISEHTAAYINMLVEAILTGMELKEELAEMQELLNQSQKESED